jgi:hypothetical protein
MRSFLIFSAMVGSTSLPPISTGLAAPMVVCGLMAATCAAATRKTPADVARAPFGPTHSSTGIRAPRMELTMARMEVTRPPGVSSSSSRAW